MVLRHKDRLGRPVIYIPAKYHSASERNIDEVTKFIVFTLEKACKLCFEEVIDSLCIIFDLKDFGLSCMDYQLVKNLIWLLSRHYPERLGVCIIMNAPVYFSGCWTIIKQWLDDNTANKVIFVNNDEELMTYLH
ncbi:CRAL-TRIO domain-containing protein, partial [Stegodyphus mimosarum]